MGSFLVLYIAAGMGAGDVKLFTAVGAFMGPQRLLVVFVLTAILGGMAGLALAASRGRLRSTLAQTGALLLGVGDASARPDALRLPYGAVIAGGTLLALMNLH